jgi:3-methyladenine DNA glycosylase/8-oxoguanine DNA glycosylase
VMEAPLGRCGLSARGKSALRRLACAAAEGRIRFDASMAFGELVTALVDEAGLERAAAQWIGMRTLAEPDADLTGRFALRPRQRAWWHAPTTRDSLRPWRSYAALLLWLSTRRGIPS